MKYVHIAQPQLHPNTSPPYTFHIFITTIFSLWKMPQTSLFIPAVVRFWSDESWLSWILCRGQIIRTTPQKLLIYYKFKCTHCAVLITVSWYKGKYKLPDSEICSRKQFLWEMSILYETKYETRDTQFLNIALLPLCCTLLNKRGSRKNIYKKLSRELEILFCG